MKKIIFLMIFGIFLFNLISAEWTFNLNEDLISYYKLDEITGTNAVDSIGNVNGTASNARVFTSQVAGIINTSADFSQGDDYINIGDISWIDYTKDLSISAWINFTTFSGDQQGVIVKSDGEGPDDTVFIVRGLNNDFRFTIRTKNDIDQTILIDNSQIGTNSLKHVVLIANQTNLAIYVNGVLKNATVRSDYDFFNPNGRSLTLGRFGSYSGNYYFNGSLDEVGFWNRSLTPGEIINLYNEGSGITYKYLGCSYEYAGVNTSIDCNSSTIFPNITSPSSVENYGKVGGILGLNWTDGITNYTENITLTDQSNLTFYFVNDTGTYSQLVDWDWKIFENEITYNSTTYESKYEGFTINLTANSSLTDVNLVYDGTSYDTTKSGTTYTTTLSVPLVSSQTNKTFYWDFVYGGGNINSTSNNQTIENLIFSLCNSTLTTVFWNFSFADEGNSSSLNGTIPSSTFYFWINNQSLNQTLSYTNTTANPTYEFCSSANVTLNVDAYIQYAASGYPQRVYDPSTLPLTNTTTNKILYLLTTDDGIYVTFQVVNTAEQVLEGVLVIANRSIGGELTTVAQGPTGADGTVTLWLNPDFIHVFSFSKSGYTTYETSFAPTQSSYTITLSGGTTPAGYDYSRGISYTIRPILEELLNGTIYNFNYTLSSSYWDVTNFGFTLQYTNGTIFDTQSASTNGGFLSTTFNTSNYTGVLMEYWWTINGTQINNTLFWNIRESEYTGESVNNFFDRLGNYLDQGIFGIDNFGRYLLIFIVLFIAVGIMSYQFGLTSPISISSMIFAMVFFFDVVLGLLPTPINAIPHSITFMALIALIVIIFREVQR